MYRIITFIRIDDIDNSKINMKNNLYLLFAALLIAAAGCKKDTQETVALPEGKFAGVFTRLHYTVKTGKVDTVRANIVLTLSTATGYTVTGDTATVHAGSHGSYVVDGYHIQFVDQTLAPNTPLYPGKTHLAGILNYAYSTSQLNIAADNDTLFVSYILQRQ